MSINRLYGLRNSLYKLLFPELFLHQRYFKEQLWFLPARMDYSFWKLGTIPDWFMFLEVYYMIKLKKFEMSDRFSENKKYSPAFEKLKGSKIKKGFKWERKRLYEQCKSQ